MCPNVRYPYNFGSTGFSVAWKYIKRAEKNNEQDRKTVAGIVAFYDFTDCMIGKKVFVNSVVAEGHSNSKKLITD